MARKIANINRDNSPRNIWWIAAAVVGFIILCGGGAIVYRMMSGAPQEELPPVPTFEFITSTAGESMPEFPTGTPQIIQTPFIPTPTSTSLPTPTNSSFFNWIFPYFSQGGQSAPVFRPSSTPLQAIVVSLTPTVTASVIPQPPTQEAPTGIACNNLLYPARPGNQWTYTVATPSRVGGVHMRIAAVEGTQAVVDVTDLSDGSTGRGFAQCDQDVILNFPLLGVESIIENFVNGTMNVDYIGGVLAPNESAFVASNWALSWKINYRVYGSGSIIYRDRLFDFSMSPSLVEMTCQTLASGEAAFENISVSAGTFRALKVICRGDGQVLAVVNGSQVTGTINAQATQWFAPGIGLLRLQGDYVNLNVFGISIPLNTSGHAGTIELNSYLVGQ